MTNKGQSEAVEDLSGYGDVLLLSIFFTLSLMLHPGIMLSLSLRVNPGPGAIIVSNGSLFEQPVDLELLLVGQFSDLSTLATNFFSNFIKILVTSYQVSTKADEFLQPLSIRP